MRHTAEDEHYMRLALTLAEEGAGFVSPNPLAGAVIVKEDRIIGKGYHGKYGGPHAERQALADCRESPKGATLYVTLEPCSHYGRTPPCTQAILESGISRVVAGMEDPNPKVRGRGFSRLRQHGVEVCCGVLEAACRAINEPFVHYITQNTPWVALKYAMTMDGKIASVTGASRWISGKASRQAVHRLRHRFSAIMVGAGTVLADDPLLTCRIPGGRNPVRIICDSTLRTPLSAKIVATAGEVPTIFAVGQIDPEKQKRYEAAGCSLIAAPAAAGRVDLAALMEVLAGRGIDSILLEGGGALAGSALAAGIVHKVYAFLAPKILGGDGAPSPVGGAGLPDPNAAFPLTPPRIHRLDGDLLLEMEVLPCSRD